MAEPTELRPLKRRIPPDLQKQVEDIQTKVPRTTGPPGDLDEEIKRWLIVGICLHSIISPLLRKYVDPFISNLYNSLVSSDFIDTQGYQRYLRKYPAANIYYLNYKSINNNSKLANNYWNYDYKVKSHVDLSKLFLKPSMAIYSAIDETCDTSALLGMVVNINAFPPAVQVDAKKIRSEIRNPWAHCDRTEWTTAKYADSFNLMGQFVREIGLSNREENQILGELNTWATNGNNYLSGTVLGLEIVEEIRQQTHVLSEYVQTLCTETDSQFVQVQKELKDLENSLQDKIRKLENKTEEHEVKLKNVSREMEDLKAEVKRQEEPHIPKNIRAQHNQVIAEWENDEASFFETRAAKCILTSVASNDCIIVTGSSGCGKSSNIHHVALHLRETFGYEIIPVLTGPSDIIHYKHENIQQVFIVDDICGKETINKQTLQVWRDYSDKMIRIFKTVITEEQNKNNNDTVSNITRSKLLISCRLHIYKELQFQLDNFLTTKECNIVSPDLCLLQKEKRQMAKMYHLDDMIDEIMEVEGNVHYFPLLCKLSKDKNSEGVLKLFTAPEDSIKKNIKHIILESEMQCCALVLCVLFDDGFNTNWLKLKSFSEVIQKQKLEYIMGEFKIDLSRERSRNALKESLATLDGTYLSRRGTEYRMIHDKITELVAVICGKKLPECFIRYASSVFIRDYFIFESVADELVDDNVIPLSEDNEEDYFERLLSDIKESIGISTFHNKLLINPLFRDKFIRYFGKSDEVKQILKDFDPKGYTKNRDADFFNWHNSLLLPLIESVSCGYYDIVHFLIDTVKCDINIRDQRGRSLLYIASAEQHLDIVKLLLQKRTELFNCKTSDLCPLYAACAKGYTDIVNLILKHNVYHYDIVRSSLNECVKGHAHIVQSYSCPDTRSRQFIMSPYAYDESLRGIGSRFESHQGRDSPLFVACNGGHIDIVKTLLQNNADINICNSVGETPLHAACRGGHAEIVELLRQNKASVFQLDSCNNSSLHAAYSGGHTDIKDMLLENIENYNDFDEIEIFRALMVECQNGNINSVELLLKKNINVNFCDIYEKKTILHVACSRGHASIVKLLLKKKANISQCNTDGKSPLYMSCANGHLDIVKILLQNNADVSQCTNDGESPFEAACANGHTEIMDILLSEK